MKTRNGFVSNSSSSSFILIVGEETYNKVMPTLTPLQIDMLKWITSKSTLDGKKICVIEGYSGHDSWTFGYYKPGQGKTGYKKGTDEEGEQSIDEEWEDIEQKLKKHSHFYSHQSY